MPWVMQIVMGPGIDALEDATPRYLATFNIEAHDGRGDAVYTLDIAHAYKWDSMEDLMAAWKAQPKARPMRPDGKPNRPLTALSISPREYKGES